MTDTQLECDIYMYSLFGIALTGAGAIGLVELGPILGFTAGGAIEGTGLFGAWEAIQNWLDETPGVPGIPSGPPASTPRVITGGAGTSTTGAAASDEVEYISSGEIRFTQSWVSPNLGRPIAGARTIDELADGLRSGRINPSEVEPIRVVDFGGDWYTLDHRRLVAFQKADMDIPAIRVSMDDPAILAEFSEKYDPMFNGQSITIWGVEFWIP